MTAIVAVLNKHAVAIAADSAVTMGDTHKVVNSANKIFTLSKYHPVAVMTSIITLLLWGCHGISSLKSIGEN